MAAIILGPARWPGRSPGPLMNLVWPGHAAQEGIVSLRIVRPGIIIISAGRASLSLVPAGHHYHWCWPGIIIIGAGRALATNDFTKSNEPIKAHSGIVNVFE